MKKVTWSGPFEQGTNGEQVWKMKESPYRVILSFVEITGDKRYCPVLGQKPLSNYLITLSQGMETCERDYEGVIRDSVESNKEEFTVKKAPGRSRSVKKEVEEVPQLEEGDQDMSRKSKATVSLAEIADKAPAPKRGKGKNKDKENNTPVQTKSIDEALEVAKTPTVEKDDGPPKKGKAKKNTSLEAPSSNGEEKKKKVPKEKPVPTTNVPGAMGAALVALKTKKQESVATPTLRTGDGVDCFGSRLGSKMSEVNKHITSDLKKITVIVEESKVEVPICPSGKYEGCKQMGSFYNHFQKLMALGFVESVGKEVRLTSEGMKAKGE